MRGIETGARTQPLSGTGRCVARTRIRRGRVGTFGGNGSLVEVGPPARPGRETARMTSPRPASGALPFAAPLARRGKVGSLYVLWSRRRDASRAGATRCCRARLGGSLHLDLECPTQNRSKTPTETRGRCPTTFVSPAPRPARQLAPGKAGFRARDANSFGSWKRLGLNGLKMRQVGLPAAPGVLLKTRGILALRARIPATHEKPIAQ